MITLKQHDQNTTITQSQYLHTYIHLVWDHLWCQNDANKQINRLKQTVLLLLRVIKIFFNESFAKVSIYFMLQCGTMENYAYTYQILQQLSVIYTQISEMQSSQIHFEPSPRQSAAKCVCNCGRSDPWNGIQPVVFSRECFNETSNLAANHANFQSICSPGLRE